MMEVDRKNHRLIAKMPKAANGASCTSLLIVVGLLVASLCNNNNHEGSRLLSWVDAVSVQRLSVPDLVVIDQLNQHQYQQQHNQHHHHQQQLSKSTDQIHRTQNINLNSNSQPEAASLINIQDLSASEQQSQITFECLISFDKRKDKHLVVKWHHDEQPEPIYQWIPELNKRQIAPQYQAYIAPVVATQQPLTLDSQLVAGLNQNSTTSANLNQTQLLEAGFRLVRPSKELGGKYTCSATSSQNDDSKWKKMTVYTPPRVFRFNASRTDIGAQMAIQRERRIQLIQPSVISPVSQSSSTHQLPLAYRAKGFEKQQSLTTTISPQMFSTIDYINVGQQRIRHSPWLVGPATLSPVSTLSHLDTTRQNQPTKQTKQQQQIGVKLVCDIDQVFPVPEVSIYRLAKLDGSHPDKLAKLDTKIERNSTTGLYHVQVISVMEDDELQMKYGLNEPVYFECLIALTNLELSKYADNKRSIIYRPGLLTSSLQQGTHTSEDINIEQSGNSSNSNVHYRNYLILRIISILSTWLVCFLSIENHHYEIL